MNLAALAAALAIAAGGLLSVGAVLMVVLLLSTRRGPSTAGAFMGGYVAGYFAIGALSIVIGDRLAGVAAAETVVAVLLIAFGSLFLFFAARNLHKVLSGNDNEPPRLFASLDAMAPRKALTVGAMVTFLNFKNLAIFTSAIGQLGAMPIGYRFASLPPVVLLFCLAPAVPIGLTLLFSRQAETWLAALKGWLERNGRRVSIVMLSLFGVLFIVKGVRGLLS